MARMHALVSTSIASALHDKGEVRRAHGAHGRRTHGGSPASITHVAEAYMLLMDLRTSPES